jgi:hypothetical protein
MKKHLLLFIFLTVSSICFSQDQCKDILEGFYNKTQTSNTGNFVKDVTNWLKSKEFKDYINNGGTSIGINVPIEGIPVGFDFGSTNQDYQKLQSYLNSGNTTTINNSFANFVSSQIVEPKVVDAWNECMARKVEQKGLVGIIDDSNGSSFFLKIRWYAVAGVQSAKIKSIWVSGAKYDINSLKKGDIVRDGWIPIAFQRKTNSQVTIAINTENNIGSYSIILPPPNKPKTNKQKCLEGDDVACLAYKNELIKKCGNNPCPNSLPCSNVSPTQIDNYLTCTRKAQCYGNRAIAITQSNDACRTFGDNSKECLESKARLQVIGSSCE